MATRKRKTRKVATKATIKAQIAKLVTKLAKKK
jgi:hypothetical protein